MLARALAFSKAFALRSWALVFGFWAMSPDLGLLKVLGLGLGTWFIARRIGGSFWLSDYGCLVLMIVNNFMD